MNTHEPLVARAMSAPWQSGVEVLLRAKNRRAVVVDLVLQDMPEAVTCPSTCWLSMADAQVLMDDLWHAGLRPTEGSGSAGALAATERHLEDMRTLVFKR